MATIYSTIQVVDTPTANTSTTPASPLNFPATEMLLMMTMATALIQTKAVKRKMRKMKRRMYWAAIKHYLGFKKGDDAQSWAGKMYLFGSLALLGLLLGLLLGIAFLWIISLIVLGVCIVSYVAADR